MRDLDRAAAEGPVCLACTRAQAAWYDYRPSPAGVSGSTAYDVSLAGIADARRARYNRWRYTVRTQQALIAAACRRGGHGRPELRRTSDLG